jgi:hypothetical protein
MKNISEVLKNKREYFYEVSYDGIKKRWSCGCGFYSMRGLPCEHELAVCVKYTFSIENQISKYWMRED